MVAADLDGKIIARSEGKSTNLASNDEEDVRKNLEALFHDLSEKSSLSRESCRYICIGSAGLDYESNCEIMKKIFRHLGFLCPISALSDSELVLHAATKSKPGAVVISGTGSIAYACDSDGNIFRSGGWGHLLDDDGSGYWIGKESIRRSLRASDGRSEKTILSDMLIKIYGTENISSCVEWVYSKFQKAEIAKLSVCVEEAAMENDKVALDILNEAADELALLAKSVIDKMNSKPAFITVSGGMIMNSEIYFSFFKEAMKKYNSAIEIKKLETEPVLGAIDLALSHAITKN